MVNRVVLVGRLVKDPELRKTQKGNAVASFSVAVDNRMKNPDGSKSTSYIPCSAWGNQGDIAIKLGKKGKLVGIEGRLNQRSYEKKDGTKASILEVIVDSITFLGPKGEENKENDNTSDVSMEKPEEEDSSSSSIDIPDDDSGLPF